MENVSLVCALNQTHLTSSTVSNETECASDTDLIPDVRQPVYMIVIYSLAYGLIFVLALTGNAVVVAVVWNTRRLHTLTNFFIVNLALSDMLVALFCLPITLLDTIFNGEDCQDKRVPQKP